MMADTAASISADQTIRKNSSNVLHVASAIFRFMRSSEQITVSRLGLPAMKGIPVVLRFSLAFSLIRPVASFLLMVFSFQAESTLLVAI